MDDQYLKPTPYLDFDHPDVAAFGAAAAAGATSELDKAIKLYYAVRDGIRYNPYGFGLGPEIFKASSVLKTKEAFCIPKAVLLAAVARRAGIPSRLGFGDVINHLSSPRLIEFLKTDVFAFHGYTEMFLEGKWVKATPAFNKSLCEKFGVDALEFDGRTDSMFQSNDKQGNQFMTYVHDHGTFADMPFELMDKTFRHYYPHLFGEAASIPEGDLESEA